MSLAAYPPSDFTSFPPVVTPLPLIPFIFLTPPDLTLNGTEWNYQPALFFTELNPPLTHLYLDAPSRLALPTFATLATCELSPPPFTFYTLTTASLSPLPSFLTFNPSTHTLTINPTSIYHRG